MLERQMLFLAVFLWIGGWSASRWGYDKRSKAPLIRPPLVIWLICGAPQAPNLPGGVVLLGSASTTITGYLALTFAIIGDWYPTELNIAVRGLTTLVLLVAFGILTAVVLGKAWPYAVGDSK